MKLTTKILLNALILAAPIGSASAATLAHRYSFDLDTSDSIGGNIGVLVGGATVSGGELRLNNSNGNGVNATSMQFTSTVGIGTNFGATGVTIESWYTDNNSGTWAKLFTFGTSAAGQELAFTNVRGGPVEAGIDRDGAHLMGPRPAINVEHHLVVTVSANGNLNSWVDGVQLLTNINTNDLSNVVSTTESIGSTAWGDPGHLGSVNEFRIWSGELTAGEVATNLALGPDLIPEPAGLALLSIGALVMLRRRR